MAVETNFPAVLGDDVVIPFELNDADGNDLDLTGALVQVVLARGDEVKFVLSTAESPGLEIAIDSPDGGLGQAVITPALQADFEPEPYNYDLRVVTADGRTSTQAYGKIFFQAGLLSWPPAS